jgi:reverse transcriptase-like protein/integrase-like protein
VHFQFAASNNEAEYEALILGINICRNSGAKVISAYSDSQLIVGQINGEYEAKDDSMKMYLQRVKSLIAPLQFSIHHIPRSANIQADSLAKLASSADGPKACNIIWEVLPTPSINQAIATVDRSATWMDPLIQFFKDNTLPEDPALVPLFMKKVKWFEFHEGILYKKSYTHPLLKSVTPEDGNYILREIHEGGCGIHQGTRTIINKALRSDYYWRTLKEDAEKLVKTCEKCQYFAEVPRKPSNYLTTI